ncbi:hypothetical protein HNQ04_002673 [Deinococcus radiopugnans ATCC 19172]|uniref:Uncharacterized protein n=1 Tax=Deinococcus radiopugnans ATCC 19172 TaxID=585398 RepID=A0ABR6NU58_9DEIO|nr:hypothetical protein [Deinococcus radiopugnans ATCC 19172]
MKNKKKAPGSEDFQDIIIRRTGSPRNERWCVVLLSRSPSGARLVHDAPSKRQALEWALEHLAGSGGYGENLARVEALEAGHVPFPES